MFGVRGEIKIKATPVGADALRAKSDVDVRFPDGRNRVRVRIESLRAHKSVYVAVLAGITDLDAAQLYVGGDIVVERASLVLKDNEYLDDDLIGCRVLDGDREVGTVRAVGHYPAQDVLELGGEKLIPLVRAFVRDIDVAARVIRVALPAGLVDADAEMA